MDTGVKDYQEVGKIRKWKQLHQTEASNRTIYPSSCGDLRGTSAGFTAVHPTRQFIDYFSTDICRFGFFCPCNILVEVINFITVTNLTFFQTNPLLSGQRSPSARGQRKKVLSERHRHLRYACSLTSTCHPARELLDQP